MPDKKSAGGREGDDDEGPRFLRPAQLLVAVPMAAYSHAQPQMSGAMVRWFEGF